jgi:hypothetical protein
MESAMRMLVTDREESLQAFQGFERAFEADADPFPRHVVGFPGGSVRVPVVHWHRSARIWGLFVRQSNEYPSGTPRPKFWNGFGVADPNQDSSLGITVEINPPHEGENRSLHGVFVRDELGLYVGHDGIFARRGTSFREFARKFAQDLVWEEITTPNGRRREVVVFGPFQERGLLSKLARYVHKVAEFKALSPPA